MLKVMLAVPLILFFFISTFSYADRIRNLASIQGIRDNQLIGYGLIVGLDGTGDQITQSPHTTQTLNNMLVQLGINLNTADTQMNVKNIAGVIVTAKLPPFSHLGEKIDVVVSSIGNAKSLRGGTLLMTPLKGADNQVYAIAQGNILVAERNTANRRSSSFHATEVNSGIINNGAIIERETMNNFGKNQIINLQLNEENFSIAQRISDMINMQYPDMAKPINSKTVQLNISANNDIQVHTISNIQDIDIPMPSPEAKVVFNSRTGSIVMNKEVRLGACAISYGTLSLLINPQSSVSTSEKIYHINKPTALYSEEDKSNIQFNALSHVNLHNIIRTLNMLGSRPDELTSILQLMKHAGCLHAKLEIIS